jgi:deoxyribodipyrimidine photolyase-like uncharacterized protein
MSPGTTLRLILGDQLNPRHTWFEQRRDDVLYVFMEMRQETDYVLHHAQKVIAIFAAMRELARQLRAAGHCVHYLTIDDPDNRQALPDNLDALMRSVQAFGPSNTRHPTNGDSTRNWPTMRGVNPSPAEWWKASTSIPCATRLRGCFRDVSNG